MEKTDKKVNKSNFNKIILKRYNTMFGRPKPL